MICSVRGFVATLTCLLFAGAAHSQTLYTEPDQGFTPIYNFMKTATKTLDMTMYELVDTTATADLAALAKKGVVVRVILDQNLEKSDNTTAYNYLNANGCHAVWANTTYHATHQKTITVDSTTSMILTANLTSRYYSSTRDFAYTDTNATDVAEIEYVFGQDYKAATVTPNAGANLIWSPNEATTALTNFINAASHTLLVETEEMSDSTIVTALENRAKAGVKVTVIMTNTDNDYETEFEALTEAGVKVYTYASDASLYIHAKIMVADETYTTAKAFLGSENFSVDSLTENRELGLTLTTSSIITSLGNTLTSDANGGTLWTKT